MALYGNFPFLTVSDRYKRDETIALCLGCGLPMILHWTTNELGRRVLSKEWK